MSYVDGIVAKFGGVRPMAKSLGYPVSTVKSWQVRGSIPDQHKRAVLEAGVAEGLTLSEVEFFPQPEASHGEATCAALDAARSDAA